MEFSRYKTQIVRFIQKQVNAEHPAFDELMNITKHEKVRYMEMEPLSVSEQVDRRRKRRRRLIIRVQLKRTETRDLPILTETGDTTRDQEQNGGSLLVCESTQESAKVWKFCQSLR